MNAMSRLFRELYWPLCRTYARRLGDKPADPILRSLCTPQFLWINRYLPHFTMPRSFSEKVWSRMLHERDPLFALISDKLRVRDYIAEKVGNEYLVPLLWTGENPEEIPFDELPMKYVIKTNHGCGYNIIVPDKKQVNKAEVKLTLKKWMRENFGQDTFLGIAWGYNNIKPAILIESFIEENGKAPVDYKCWCFSGRIEFISLHFDRFDTHSTLSFDRNFEPGGVNFGLPLYSQKFDCPGNHKEIVRVAETLAADFDFMRVDLYNVKDRIYVGEFTPYPGGVSVKFDPESLDFALGEKWKKR